MREMQPGAKTPPHGESAGINMYMHPYASTPVGPLPPRNHAPLGRRQNLLPLSLLIAAQRGKQIV